MGVLAFQGSRQFSFGLQFLDGGWEAIVKYVCARDDSLAAIIHIRVLGYQGVHFFPC